jgi:hypothetical protein
MQKVFAWFSPSWSAGACSRLAIRDPLRATAAVPLPTLRFSLFVFRFSIFASIASNALQAFPI